MAKRMRIFALVLMVVILAVMLACSGNSQPGANAPASTSSRAVGTLTAEPNPIQVCDQTGLGKTTLTWSSTGATDVELHSPDGTMLARGTSGKYETGKWVYDGAEFYLQDVSQGKAPTQNSKLAIVQVTLTKINCP